MGSQTQGKLNWLQHALPEGLVVDSGWLERHNVSRQIRRKYVMHGWLLLLARGVYCRPSPLEQPSPLPWQQLAISLNALQNLAVAAGGRTALELHGFSHYLAASGSREAHLFANEEFPGWVPATGIMRTLQVGDHPARLAQAIAEFGRIEKTLHTLNMLDDETKRRGTLSQLNRSEGRHSLGRAVFHHKRVELRQRYREGKEDQRGALGLVLNMIVLWNTIYTEAALD